MADYANLRRTNRAPVAMSAVCRSDSSSREFAAIADLSPEGCRIASTKPFLHVGQRVIVIPETLSGLNGTVRWCIDSIAGIEFERPLYLPVYEHLCRTFSAPEGDASPAPAEQAGAAPTLPDFLRSKIVAGYTDFHKKEGELPRLTRTTPHEPRPGLRARQTNPEVVKLFLRSPRWD